VKITFGIPIEKMDCLCSDGEGVIGVFFLNYQKDCHPGPFKRNQDQALDPSTGLTESYQLKSYSD
jgi:hypothetical protein